MKVPSSIGIVGAGTMGSYIAGVCIKGDKTVYLCDVSQLALERAKHKIRNQLQGDETEIKNCMSRLFCCQDLEKCVNSVEVVLENVPENIELKRQVFAEIERLAPPHVLIGTNSSSIPPSRLVGATNRPEKFYNANFSPPTVEIMGHPGTSKETLDTVESFIASIGLLPLRLMKESMGYALNRTWRAVKREALHLIASGVIHFEDFDRGWMLDFGTTIGPFGMMDMVGLDVVRDIENQYFQASGDEDDRPPEFLEKMIANGFLGEKSGRGFYNHPDPEYKQPGWLRKELPWMPDYKLVDVE